MLASSFNRVCHHCGCAFVRKQIRKESKHIFCSPGCSRKSHNPKPLKKKCLTCKCLIQKRYTHCRPCKSKILLEKSVRPISKMTYKKPKFKSNQYTLIRCAAKHVVKGREKKCIRCGYDKHVEVCHIKPISSFDPSTSITIVNHPDNLILLCPNCHWEYDQTKKMN